jgi:hypothetical protein
MAFPCVFTCFRVPSPSTMAVPIQRAQLAMARNRIKSLEESESYLRREYEDALAKIAILQDEVVALRSTGGSSQPRPPVTRSVPPPPL